MCNKLVCLTILVLIVGLVYNASAAPAPVGWWKFDEGADSTAYDSSINGNNGTISEGVSWVPGQMGPYALDFTGGVVTIPDAPELRPSTVTACAWISLSGPQGEGARVLQKGDDNHETYVFQGGGYGMNFTLLDTGLDNHSVSLANPLWHGEWIHLAGTYDGSELIIYVNGEPDNSAAAGSFTPYQSVGEFLYIGARSAGGDRPWNGMIDDVRIYNTALSPTEIQRIYWEGEDPNFARDPSPDDGEGDVSPDVVLSWTAGLDAVSHDVYFGTDFEDVNSAMDPNVLPGRGRQSNASYDPTPAGILELGTTYYWRIDEVSGLTLNIGDVWLFTVDDGKASGASPGNNDLDVPTDANLSWTAGLLATSHDVYFGSSLSDVNDSATPVSAGQVETSYDLGPLEEDTVYYWRVDEHGATTYAKGNIWNFRTEGRLCLKVDLVLTQCWEPYDIIPGTAKPGWWPWIVRGTDMYMHDSAWERGEDGHGPPPDTDGIAGTGIHVAITCGGEGNGGFHVHGMCRDNLGGGGCPTGAPDGDPIANGWFHNIDWGGELTGDVLMRINNLPPGEYVLISYHNHWEPCTQGTRNCLNCTSNMPNMPRVSAQSLPTDSLGYNFGFQLGTGMGVTPLQDACDVDVSCVTSDDDVSTSTISFYTDGSDVLVIYDGGDNTYPDPARPGREGSKGILNAFQIILIRAGEISWRPSPREGADNISPDVVLGWEAGETTVSHDVYFGGDWNDVNDANKSSIEYKGSQILEADTHDPCDLLGFEETYYWRIDEVNELSDVYKGKVWSFTTYNGKASNPSPTNGAKNVAQDVELGWSHSFPAASHDVYFGTDWDDVNDANKSSSEYKGSQTLEDDTYDPCGPLGLNKTYYWRIDEVNNTNVWKGAIWRFTVANYIVIDDMEDYLSTADILANGWKDGSSPPWNGSYLFLQTVTPVRGNQSMKYVYDNTFNWGAGYYAEIESRNLDPNNWTLYDLRVLSLWFYGESDNTATGVEPMFLAVEDYNNVYVELRYGDGEDEDADDISIEEWQEWSILLSSLNDANLASLRALFIRFGEERFWPFPGGYGDVYFDDIRLYTFLCRPDKGQPEGDLNNDCTVDFEDVEIMTDEWLESDVFVEVVKPDANGLVGWWKLDDGGGSVVTDYAGYDNNGVIETLDDDVSWVAAGHDGNALKFEGGRVRVPDHQDLRPMHQVSACAWIYYSEGQNNARVVTKGSNDFETYDLEVNGYKLIFLVRDGNDMDDGKYKDYRTESTWDIDRDEWVHVAGTYDGNAVKCYINGEVAGTNNEANSLGFLSQNTDDLAIGSQPDGDENPFEGMIDDVRVYDYGLSAEEVVWFATDETGIFTVQSIANLYNEEDLGKRAVNFRDFAVIADSWLETQRWPE